jgi:t-SNARE complex subunit (syntaxin)
MLSEVALWIAKTIGAEKLKQALNRSSLTSENRSLKKALRESQERREELERVNELLARVARDRDDYFAEVVRLRQEIAALRAELARPGDGR